MRNRLPLIALCAIAALAVAACGGSSSSTVTSTVTETQTQSAQTEQQPTDTQQEPDTTQGDQGTVYTEQNTQIAVQTGDSFTIELAVNPSTGYHWQVDLPMGYVQVSDEILQPEDAGNVVGQGTTERWVFSADTPGTGAIDFKLLPPGSDTPEKTVTFTVDAS